MALPNPSRSAAAAKTRAIARKQAALLADAPVPAPRKIEPLLFGDRVAATVRIVTESYEPIATGEDWARDGFRTHIGEDAEYDNAGNDRAALRHQLAGVYLSGSETRPGIKKNPERVGDREYVGAGAHEAGGSVVRWVEVTDQGPRTRERVHGTARVAVLLDDGRSFILEGSWAAIRRAVPDRETVKVWKEAGVTEFPLYDFTGGEDTVRVRWVPIDQAPKVVQIEYESRGLRAEAIEAVLGHGS